MGNLVRDPELRYTPQGSPVCDITLAVTKKGKGGTEKTSFIDCTLWGRTAETIAEFCSKGKALIVRGELQQDKWEDKETGAKRSKIKVQAYGFEFLPRSGSGDEAPQEEGAPQESATDTDDIPF